MSEDYEGPSVAQTPMVEVTSAMVDEEQALQEEAAVDQKAEKEKVCVWPVRILECFLLPT